MSRSGWAWQVVRRHRIALAVLCSFAAHFLLALFFSLPSGRKEDQPTEPIAFEVREVSPPEMIEDPVVTDVPPPEVDAVEPPPPPSRPRRPRPRPVAKSPPPQPEQRPEETPQKESEVPPEEVAPPKLDPDPEPAPEAQPVFGASESSVIETPDKETTVVSTGNTRLTRPGTGAGKKASSGASEKGTIGGTGTRQSHVPFRPAPPSAVKSFPKVIADVVPERTEAATRMGVTGQVLLSVGIDEKGRVVEVRALSKLGYGLEERAKQAMRKFRFSPGISHQGTPIPMRINYKFTFR